jgi:transposase InsO family protein
MTTTCLAMTCRYSHRKLAWRACGPRILDAIVEERGQPLAIRCDNGPELTSRHFLAWCVGRQIELIHIQPGKPTQRARVESFHGRLREACLNVSWFRIYSMRGGRLRRGRTSTTKNDPTAAWDIGRRRSLLPAMRAAEAGSAFHGSAVLSRRPGVEKYRMFQCAENGAGHSRDFQRVL